MLEELIIAGAIFMKEHGYAVFNWFGMFILSLLALVTLRRGRKSGRRELLVKGLLHGTFGAMWFITMCIPWANVIASTTSERRAVRLYDSDEDRAAELFYQAESYAAVAEKQSAFLGAVFFTVSALALIIVGASMMNKVKAQADSRADAGLGTINLALAIGYAVFGFICTAKYISVAGIV